ncbi:hypothetical protein CI109_100754 [Kwoniella shandongensis]|uniref:N(6)-L-threonylcarbamoyladenine synthase n=1 Tax=Kwoniella shandongensis TaxID=1734106 RepID=A0A5M6BMS7_9TREE|nr:uncharacterized protein CI109_007498 [Kwoniella shandongensis]KAA5524184.1 hypothetical protein CI109_007498 [Kwoniella shandongensis]
MSLRGSFVVGAATRSYRITSPFPSRVQSRSSQWSAQTKVLSFEHCPTRCSSSSSASSASRSSVSSSSTYINPGHQDRPLIVLGLESSCDDSSCSIVTSTREILSLQTISQHTLNSSYGGVHPLAAQIAHSANIPRAIERCLAEAGIGWGEIDAVAYTRGPGMKGCLGVGEMAAKGLASGLGKRLVGIHHMQAHALTPLLTESDPPQFPFLILLVSGGHTQLVLAEAVDKFKILLDTLDSKVGDAFEKSARLLSLPPHPSRSPGSILEHYASLPTLPPYNNDDENTTASRRGLPIPLSMNEGAKRLAFSFAGLLSALERQLELDSKAPSSSTSSPSSTTPSTAVTNSKMSSKPHPTPLSTITEAQQRHFSRLFQNAATKHIVLKLTQAIEALNPALCQSLDGLVVSGGVASNLYLRGELEKMVGRTNLNVKEGRGMRLFYPPIALCTDNAAMIAWTAILRMQAGLESDPYDLPLRPKWSLDDLYDDVP